MLLDCSKMWICEYEFPIVSFYHLSGGMRLIYKTSRNSFWQFLGELKQQQQASLAAQWQKAQSQHKPDSPQENTFTTFLRRVSKESPVYPKEQGTSKCLSEILRKITFNKNQKVVSIKPTHISLTP